MQKIKIISDSACDLSLETAKEHNIGILPVRVIYKNREFLDKFEITAEELYASLSEEIPTTSLPDMGYCEKVFDEIKSEGYTDVIVITVSSKLSGTLNSLKLLTQDYEGLNFSFFDTRTLGYPEGTIALETAAMVDKGMQVEEILENLENMRKRVFGYVAVNTLEYMVKGGRISKIKGAIGEMIHLKPIISSNDEGALYKYAQTRGRVQSINKLKKILEEHLEKSPCKVWVLSGDSQEEAEAFYNYFKGNPRIEEIYLEKIGPSMGVHTGPKALGLSILEINDTN